MSAPVASRLERVISHDRRIVLVSLAVLCALCWVYLLVMAKQMAEGDMSLMGMEGMSGTSMSQSGLDEMAMARESGISDSSVPSRAGSPTSIENLALTTTMSWTGTTFVLMFVMWWVMMVGMMVPSAAPMILLFALIHRKQLADQYPFVYTAAFTTGYLMIWGVFSAIAVGLQWWLTETFLLSAMMVSTSKWLAAGLLVTAGIYQLTPFKAACLRHCRSPIHFLSTHWRNGNVGSLRMGIEHGAYCLGCCWLLMALLFVGGVMNLFWVAALAVLVLLEKVVPRGDLVGKMSGLAMLGGAAYLAV